MQPAVFSPQMLDGDHMATVERRQKPDAGIDGLIFQNAAGQPANQHRAGAAVAFRTAFLGACQPALQTQVVEQGLVGRCIRNSYVGAVQQKPDFRAVGHRVLGQSLLSTQDGTPRDLHKKSGDSGNTFNKSLKIVVRYCGS